MALKYVQIPVNWNTSPAVVRTRPICLHNGCVRSVDREKKMEKLLENKVLKLLYVD